VPLVYVNREPIDVDKLGPKAAFVASNEAESGTLEAKQICKLLGGKGNILVMEGVLSNQSAVQRTQDVHEVISTPDCSGVKVVAEQTANYDRTQAQNLMTNWLSKGLKFDAVVSNNDEMAIGAIQSLKQARLLDSTIVAGIDATPDALVAMRAGQLKVTVFQNAPAQGRGAVDTAVKLMHNEPVPSFVWVPFELVTPANLPSYLGRLR
jgi:ABC-type sugar transport system substrate-binding protein